MRILNDIAQDIVEKASDIIKFPISIINREGIIVGSTDKDRIGLLHQPLLLNKEQELNSENINMKSILPGKTAPIVINGIEIGVLGIIGDYDKVKKYVYLVKNQVEMMCQEAFREETESLKAKMIETFIQKLLHYKDEKLDERLMRYVDILGYDPNIERLCILIEIYRPNKSKSDWSHMSVSSPYFQKDILEYLGYIFGNSKEDIQTFINLEQILVVKPIYKPSDYDRLVKCLKLNLQKINKFLSQRFDLQAVMSVGEIEKKIYGITRSYLQAAKAMLSNRADTKILFYSDKDSAFQSLHKGVSEEYQKRLIGIIKPLTTQNNYDVLAETFLTYCHNDLNLSATSRKMYVHRNTILYRLEKIKELTDFEITTFQDCLVLYLAIISYENLKGD